MNFNNRCHGGALFALGDMALGLACNSYGKIATLVDGQLSISTAVEDGEWLVAHAYEVSRSRKIGSYQVKITRARDGEHIAMLHGTVYVLDKSVEAPVSEGCDERPVQKSHTMAEDGSGCGLSNASHAQEGVRTSHPRSGSRARPSRWRYWIAASSSSIGGWHCCA